MQYQNLDLETSDYSVQGNVERFRVRVISSPAGGQRGFEAVEVEVPPDLRKLLRRLDGRRLDLRGMIGLGIKLGSLLFPPEVRDYLDNSLATLKYDEGLRVRLRLETFALASFPWEYVYLLPKERTIELWRILVENFDEDELVTACCDFEIDYQGLPGRGKATKARELIDYLVRQGRILELIGVGKQVRPDVSWGADPRLDGFIALDRKISLVRYEVQGQPLVGVGPGGVDSVRLVILMASPDGYPKLRLGIEKGEIEKAVEGSLSIKSECHLDATIQTLETAFRQDAHIFHFAGHGEFDGDLGERYGSQEGKGFLVFLDDDGVGKQSYSAERLAANLKGRGLRLVVLCACHTARRGEVNPWTGVVPALTRTGIPAIVGMQFGIQDENAVAFSRSFYRTLTAGQSVDAAVHNGRLAVLNRCVDNDRDWGVPVLYLHHRSGNGEDGVLFPRLSTGYDEQLDRARDLRQRGMLAYEQGDYSQAERYYWEALEIREDLLVKHHKDIALDVAQSKSDLASVYQAVGKHMEALPLLQQALKISRSELGDTNATTARRLTSLASLHESTGDTGAAERCYGQALEIYRTTLGEGHPEFVATLNKLADLYYSEHNYTEAEQYYRQALGIHRSIAGEDEYFARILHNLGGIAREKSNYTKAHELFVRSLEIKEKLGDQTGITNILHQLGQTAQGQGYEQARKFYRQSLERSEELGDRATIARSLLQLGIIARSTRDFHEARQFFQQSLECSRELKIERCVADNLEQLGLLAYQQGDYEQACLFDQQSRSIREDLALMEQLPAVITEYFSEGQVRAICAELGVKYDELLGEGHSAKASELVIEMRLRKELKRLKEVIKNRRPDVPIYIRTQSV